MGHWYMGRASVFLGWNPVYDKGYIHIYIYMCMSSIEDHDEVVKALLATLYDDAAEVFVLDLRKYPVQRFGIPRGDGAGINVVGWMPYRDIDEKQSFTPVFLCTFGPSQRSEMRVLPDNGGFMIVEPTNVNAAKSVVPVHRDQPRFQFSGIPGFLDNLTWKPVKLEPGSVRLPSSEQKFKRWSQHPPGLMKMTTTFGEKSRRTMENERKRQLKKCTASSRGDETEPVPPPPWKRQRCGGPNPESAKTKAAPTAAASGADDVAAAEVNT
jgi:hypothetical protein